MVSSKVLVSVVVMLVAMLLGASLLAAMYYGLAEQRGSEETRYKDELSSALTKFSGLSSSFNSSLEGYNTTLSLLSDALANLNTSSATYSQGSRALGHLWAQYLSLMKAAGVADIKYSVDLFVDFGNGSRTWHNDTSIQPGWNAYLATVVVFGGKVDASWYPQFQEHYVTGIGGAHNGVASSWFFWLHNGTAWQLAPTGADATRLFNGTVFAWSLCGFDAGYNPTCNPAP